MAVDVGTQDSQEGLKTLRTSKPSNLNVHDLQERKLHISQFSNREVTTTTVEQLQYQLKKYKENRRDQDSSSSLAPTHFGLHLCKGVFFFKKKECVCTRVCTTQGV